MLCQNILLDKYDKKSAEYLDRQQSFVKNKLDCSQSKSRWQISVYFSLIRGFFQIKGLCMESQRWKKPVISQCERFGLDVHLIGPQLLNCGLVNCLYEHTGTSRPNPTINKAASH